MLRNFLATITILSLVSPLGGCGARPNTKAEPTGVIVVGDISLEAEYRKKRFEPIADYLAEHLNQVGIGKGEVKIAPDKGPGSNQGDKIKSIGGLKIESIIQDT